VRRAEQDALREMLKEERVARALTAKDVSLKLRLHSTYISRVERGYRTVDVIEVIDILEAIGAEPKSFFLRFLDRTWRRPGKSDPRIEDPVLEQRRSEGS